MNRRDLLIRGLHGGAALALGAGAARLPAAGKKTLRQLPDHSGRSTSSPVAIQRCRSYDPSLVRRRLDGALELLGGIGDLVRGKTVTVKLNLTGRMGPCFGRPAYRTYQVHPHVVGALCGALHEAGAKRIVVVESLFVAEPITEALRSAGWDIDAIESAGGRTVQFVDTRNRGDHDSYSTLKVSYGGWLYPAFHVHRAYEKTDVFISLAKLKNHSAAGVTLGAKNLFGMPPNALYGNDAPNENSTAPRWHILHHGRKETPEGVPDQIDPDATEDPLYRVPRITADVLGARPVDLTVIDGVESIRGGEGHWIGGTGIIEPHLLLAGRNAVCTDAVTTRVMDHDPLADHFSGVFPGENHLRLLNRVGLGVIDPAEIEVRGLSIQEALCPFAAAGRRVATPGAYHGAPSRR